MTESFQMTPVGRVRVTGDAPWIDIEAPYADALLGLEGFSHMVVCYWLHRNDTAADRCVLRVHPRGIADNPLTGVFATHSPKRPNPVAISVCRIREINGLSIAVDGIDAFDGSPVVDIKCYIPTDVPDAEVRLPDWV